MSFVIALVVIFSFVVSYFFLGLLFKFFISWWILALGIPGIFIVSFSLGWVGAVVAILGLVALLEANNKWHDSGLCIALERKIDAAFYLSDT